MTRWWSWTFGLFNHQPHSQVAQAESDCLNTNQVGEVGRVGTRPEGEEKLGGFAFQFFFGNRLFGVIE